MSRINKNGQIVNWVPFIVIWDFGTSSLNDHSQPWLAEMTFHCSGRWELNLWKNVLKCSKCFDPSYDKGEYISMLLLPAGSCAQLSSFSGKYSSQVFLCFLRHDSLFLLMFKSHLFWFLPCSFRTEVELSPSITSLWWMNPGVFKDSLDCKLCRGRVSPYPFNQYNPRTYSRLTVHSSIDQIELKWMEERFDTCRGFGMLLIHSIDNRKLQFQAIPTWILLFQLVLFL